MEQQLRQAQEEVSDLKTKVREAIRIAEQQKNQFRTCIEELRSQLHQAVRDRDLTLHNKYVAVFAVKTVLFTMVMGSAFIKFANVFQKQRIFQS